MLYVMKPDLPEIHPCDWRKWQNQTYLQYIHVTDECDDTTYLQYICATDVCDETSLACNTSM